MMICEPVRDRCQQLDRPASDVRCSITWSGHRLCEYTLY